MMMMMMMMMIIIIITIIIIIIIIIVKLTSLKKGTVNSLLVVLNCINSNITDAQDW